MLKNSILHLPAFLIIFAAIFAVLVFLSLLAGWTGVYNPAFPQEPGWLGNQIRLHAGNVLLAAVFLSLFLLFFRIRKKPGNRFVTLVIALSAAFAVTLAAITAVYGPPGNPLPKKYGVLVPFIPKTVHQGDDGLVYVEEVEGMRLTNTVLYSGGEVRHIPDATVAVRSSEDAAVILPSGGGSDPVAVTPANPVYRPVFDTPGFISSLKADLVALNGYLLEKRSASPGDFSLSLLSVLLFAVGCVRFMVSSRWPLFGALVTLASFRGLLLLLRFYESDIGVEIRSMLPAGILPDMAFTLVVFVLGALLTAMVFAFPGKRNG